MAETLTVFALYTLTVLAAGYVLGRPTRRRGAHICPGPDEDPRKSGGLKASDAPGSIEKPEYDSTTISKGRPENGT